MILIEATGLGGPKLRLVLLPGLLGAGHRDARLARHGFVDRAQHQRLRARTAALPAFPRPDAADFAWTIPLAVAIACVTAVVITVEG